MNASPIAFLIDDLGQGGAQGQLAMIAGELVRRGHAVTVLTYAPRDFMRADFEAVGVLVMALGSKSRIGHVRAIRAWVKRHEPRVLVSFLKGPNSLSLLAKRTGGLRCPLVVGERSVDGETGLSLKRRLALRLYGTADAIVCNSQRQADWLAEEGPLLTSRISVIGNAVDLDRFSFCTHPTGAIGSFLILARVVHEKGQSLLADALCLLRERNETISFDWYGLRDENSIDAPNELIRFHEPRHDVEELLAASDALCLPSLSEGTPNVVLEAMAVGRPVLATDVGDVRRLVDDGETGWVVPAGDPRALADALAAAARTPPAKVQAMSRAGRAAVENVASIGSIVDGYERVFASIGVERF